MATCDLVYYKINEAFEGNELCPMWRASATHYSILLAPCGTILLFGKKQEEKCKRLAKLEGMIAKNPEGHKALKAAESL